MAYFANGSEGMVLNDQCDQCCLDIDMPCPILQVYLEYNYKQVNNPDLRAAMNILVDEKGMCVMRMILDEKIRRVELDPRQRSLFNENIGS